MILRRWLGRRVAEPPPVLEETTPVIEPAPPPAVQRGLVLVAAPHPASRILHARAAALLAAQERDCRLVLDPAEPLPADSAVLHLRSAAADALTLIAPAVERASAEARRGLLLLDAQDRAWGHLPRLVLEDALGDRDALPAAIARVLDIACAPEVPAPEAMPAIEDVVSFLETVGGPPSGLPAPPPGHAEVDLITRWIAARGLRTMLVVSGKPDAAHDALPPGPPVIAADRFEAEGGPFDLILFHALDGRPDISVLAERALPLLTPNGLLCGREADVATLRTTLSALTPIAFGQDLTLLMQGGAWVALPRAPWRP